MESYKLLWCVCFLAASLYCGPGVKCQPTADSWRREFQRTDEEEEFCFGFYCNRSERVCGKKSFDCLAVFPEDSTDENKTQLCWDLIDKGDKSVLSLKGSIDVCRYRFGKNRNQHCVHQDQHWQVCIAYPIILLLLLLGCVMVIVRLWDKNSWSKLQMWKPLRRQTRESGLSGDTQDNSGHSSGQVYYRRVDSGSASRRVISLSADGQLPTRQADGQLTGTGSSLQ